MNKIRACWNRLTGLFEDDAPSDEAVYDPAHVAGVVVGCLTGLGVLYWLLWSLLVCEGGLFTKIGPFLQVVFTSKTLADFGYEGYPYELGVFEGWIVNAGALIFTIAAVAALWWMTQPPKEKK
jgi:uncharacterized membrane protein YedE/YeeE